ncbi:MAG: phosphoribosylaminoimidazolesuccinocarboxamide synthase [Candidatus Moraniibacteriota bacterium]
MILLETNISVVPLLKRGKVRDIYNLGDHLLMITPDRLSAFDVVMPDCIPEKGKVLNQISLFWFAQMAGIIPNHVVAHLVKDFPKILHPYAEILEGRSILVKKAVPLEVECIVRGYLSGGGWKSYKENGTICGIKLPKGLRESDRLPEPIFTPSTKAELGKHDENIDFDTAAGIIGREIAERVRDLSLRIYKKGAELALRQGIIIADTKFEFGIYDDELILIDEVLTPDSSRFWPADEYEPGRPQNSFDKQFVRDYLESIKFNKQPPGPRLPQAIIEGTQARYLEALERLTGHGIE